MPSMSEREVCLCALDGVIAIIARKWSLFVLNVVGNSRRVRFNQIMEQLDGISPTTLSETLERLVGLGLVKREAYAETPPRVEYSLTVEGSGLRNAINPLLLWAARKNPVRGMDPGCPGFARVCL